MICEICKFENNEESNFCTQCGTSLGKVCHNCYHKVSDDDVYCSNCGIRLGVSLQKESNSHKVSTTSAVLNTSTMMETLNNENSQRKTVTVLFADISGFTAMSEKMDPEEVTIVMNQCLSMMGDCVTKYDGYIDKFIGDCIMAIFGAPTTHENDPELALLSALQMNKNIKEFNENLPVKLEKPLSIHTGINTGLVVAGKMGSDSKMEYTVMGDTVNLASRLESKAKNGQIFISSYTYHQTKKLFEFIKHEPVEVKGKKDPVDVYEVVRALEDSEIKTGSTIDIPIVGREKEIKTLANCTSRLKKGEGQAIFLISDPGFGKSRIQIELKKEFVKDQIQFIEGRCHSFSKNTPYKMFINIFKSLCGINNDDLKEAIVEKFTVSLPLLLGEDKDFLSDETRKMMVLIAKLMDIEIAKEFDVSIENMTLQQINGETIKAISRVFEIFSKSRPLVLSLEDLHYADTASIEIINKIINSAKTNNIMIVLLFRPEKNSPCSKLLPYARRVLADRALEIIFDRLTRDECEDMVKHILGENIPSQLLEIIGSKSDGNPLFIQEILHTLVENKVIAKEKDSIKVLQDLQSISIPSSITGIVMSRFDQLNNELRDFLSLASVIGTTFGKELMCEFIDENRFDQYIEILINSEMIFESSSFPDIKYSFKTSFIQESIYSTILLQRRKSLHLKVSQMIEKVYKSNLQEHLESLADHYFEAQEFEKAFQYQVQSAYKSKNIFANDIAAMFFRKAIETITKVKNPSPDICELSKSYSEVLEFIGDTQTAIKSWNNIITYSQKNLEKANALRNIGRIEEKRGYKDKAIEMYDKAINMIKDQTHTVEYGEILMNISWVLNRFKNIDEAIQKAQEALKIFEINDSKYDIALCYNNLAVFYENKECFDTALDYNKKSLNLFKTIKDKKQIGNVELSLGYLYNKRGELDKALEHFTLSQQVMDMIDNTIGIATALLAKGRCLEDMKQYDEAKTVLLSAMKRYEELNILRRVVATSISLINVLLDMEDINTAYRYINDTLQIAIENDFKSDIAKLKRLNAIALVKDGREIEAIQRYKEAIVVLQDIDRNEDAKKIKKEIESITTNN